MVVVLIDGVVYVPPVPKDAPPLAAAYQLMVVPELLVAPNVSEPVPHLDAGVVVRICGLFTVMVSVLEYPGAPALQVTLNR